MAIKEGRDKTRKLPEEKRVVRRKRRLFCAILFSFGIGLGVQADLSAARSQEPGNKLMPLTIPHTAPAPPDNPTTAEKVELGKQLFFDPRLSGDNTRSCAGCHVPEKAFTDGLPKSRGAGGKQLSRNTPGLLNAGFYTSYFWELRYGSSPPTQTI